MVVEDIAHGVLFVRSLTDKGYLHARQAEGLVRASHVVLNGVNDGIAFLAEPNPEMHVVSLSTSSTPLCPPGAEPPCYYFDVLHFLNALSYGPGKEHGVFLALRVDVPYRQEWERSVLEIAAGVDKEHVYLAAAHLFGGGPYNGMVEILTEDRPTLLRLWLQLTDVPGVSAVFPHTFRAEDARGMGSTGV